MSILLEVRLRQAAKLAASGLRGFADQSFHTGSLESFYGQFRRVLEQPVIRSGRNVISFAAATVLCRLDGPGTGVPGNLARDLAGLLGGPLVNDAGERQLISRQTAEKDVRGMLGVPAMRFYFRAEDRAAFEDGVRRLADQVTHPVEIGTAPIEERPAEQFRLMELSAAVSAWLSYDMLRLVTECVPITTYQAEDYVTAT